MNIPNHYRTAASPEQGAITLSIGRATSAGQPLGYGSPTTLAELLAANDPADGCEPIELDDVGTLAGLLPGRSHVIDNGAGGRTYIERRRA